AYENFMIYKERMKKLHDSKIKNRIFNVGDQVLLFCSRFKIFSGKVKTHWSGPFTITRVYSYGTIELSQPNGLNFKGIDFMGPFLSSKGNKYILVAVDYLSKWVEVKALPTNDARVVVKFLKSLFSRFERTVGENHASWSDKLDDALWAFRTAYKTPIGCTPYKLVYGKSCHLPIELEHMAYWPLKHVNFDLKIAGDHRKLQLNELSELRDQAYENFMIYKERMKKLHDSKIKNRIFNVGDQVLLFCSRLKIFSGKVNGHRVKHYFGGDIPSNVASDLQTFLMDN
nr:hypothetical protein [Tanacetum cinerariifolium]